MNNSQLPAAPLHNDELVKAFIEVEQVSPNGLTKREHFAAMAMQNIVSSYNPYEQGDFDSSDFALTAKLSVGLADALLKELAK